MTALNKLASLNEAMRHARQLAEQGYGWCDLVVRCGHRLSVDTAKTLVWEAERRRLAGERGERP